MSIPVAEQRKLHTRSDNRCAFPNCREWLSVEATAHDRVATLGEDAHIVAEKPGGPRGDSPMTLKERNRYENLILLCNNHHDMIDSQPASFLVKMLHDWKATHEAWVRAVTAGEVAQTAPTADTPYALLGRERYLDVAATASDQRRSVRRLGAGLSEGQAERSLRERVAIPAELVALPAGEARVLTGALGSGKSDMAEEWHRASIETSRGDSTAAVPVWVRPELLLHKALEDHLVGEIGLDAIAGQGVDVVVDGLDEHTEDATKLLIQGQLFVERWPRSRVVLAARAIEQGSPVREVAAPLLDDGHAQWLMEAVAGRPLPH